MGCKKEPNEKRKTPTVYVEKSDGDFRLIRNGKPFYIKGGAAHPDYLRELKDAGANTARIYDTINLQQTLDLAEELGLAVIVDIPLPKHSTDSEFYKNELLFNHIQLKLENLVRKFKDHPAILYWNLGNEIHYPLKRFYFFSNYKKLVNTIKEIDPNHPVSTAVSGGKRERLTSIAITNPNLDLNSINIFGEISNLRKRPEFNKSIWKTPYVISEWGVNGPWEAKLTKWNAPIEETSTKKAEQIKERYYNYLKPLDQINSFGNLIFYWGEKNEVTPTWFSLFGLDKSKTQGVFEMEKIWNNNPAAIFLGPELEYILLNDKGAADNIILAPGKIGRVAVKLPENKHHDLEYKWEIRKESWNASHISETVNVDEFQMNGNHAEFYAPIDEGPYRVFLYLTNGTGYIATANIPFYVLNPRNEE